MVNVSKKQQTSQAELVSPAHEIEGQRLSLLRSWRREAMHKCGWKHAAIARQLGRSENYLSRQLREGGDKYFTDLDTVRMPEEIVIEVAITFLELKGFIVVAPMTQADCDRKLAEGLFGRLRAVWATSPIKATLAR